MQTAHHRPAHEHVAAATRPLTALDAIFSRRSVRAYAPKPLDASTVRALLDAAVQAPTAMHAEPWAFVVVQDRAALKRYSEIAKGFWAKEVEKYRDLHLGESPAQSAFAEQFASPEFSVFYDAGTLIVICANTSRPFAVADCWLAAENLMLAACALGLGTCCIGSAVAALNTPTVKAELNIAADMEAVAPIIVGVPRELPPAVTRHEPQVLAWR
jgi:nitroreductase